MGKRHEQNITLTERVKVMVIRKQQRCSASLVIREMQIKLTTDVDLWHFKSVFLRHF